MERFERVTQEALPKKETPIPRRAVVYSARGEGRHIITHSIAEQETTVPIGEIINSFRNDHELTQEAFAHITGMSHIDISRIESGHKIIHGKAMPGFVSGLYRISLTDPKITIIEEDLLEMTQGKPAYEALREHIDQEREERNWFITIYNIPWNKGIKYLRLSERIPANEFEKEIESAEDNLLVYEQGRIKPTTFILNNIINNSPINNQGKAAALLRLKYADENVMSLAQLAQCTPGGLVKYLRIQRGQTQRELGKLLGLSQTNLSRLERGLRKFPPKQLRERIISWLDLPPQSALAQVITRKSESQTDELTDALLRDISFGSYLFGDYSIDEPYFELAQQDKDLMEEVKTLYSEGLTINDIFRTIRSKRNLSRRDVVQSSKNLISLQQIQNIENKSDIPKEVTIVIYAQSLSYPIHHPLMHLLLDIAEQERTKRHKGRRKQRE